MQHGEWNGHGRAAAAAVHRRGPTGHPFPPPAPRSFAFATAATNAIFLSSGVQTHFQREIERERENERGENGWDADCIMSFEKFARARANDNNYGCQFTRRINLDIR